MSLSFRALDPCWRGIVFFIANPSCTLGKILTRRGKYVDHAAVATEPGRRVNHACWNDGDGRATATDNDIFTPFVPVSAPRSSQVMFKTPRHCERALLEITMA